jgi:hypothetical protein
LRELPDFSDEDLESVLQSSVSKVSTRRLGGRLQAADIKPQINVTERLIVVPATFKNPDNSIGHAILRWSRRLNYKIKVIPYYEDKMTDISDWNDKIGMGIFMSSDELEGKCLFRFTKKQDPYEVGRTCVRSAQILGALATIGHGPETLKLNDFYFGNAGAKKKGIVKAYQEQLLEEKGGTGKKKKREPEEYWTHSAPALFREHEWRKELSDLLIQLLRQSYVLVDEDTLWTGIVPYTVTYSEVVQAYCAREVVVEPQRGKRPALTKLRVPSKPKANALLLKDELRIIDTVSAPLWQPTPWEKLSQADWAEALFANGLSKIREDLVKLYTARGNFLSKLSSVTTKRLQTLRAMSDRLKQKRKSDITVSDLDEMLLSRDDPISMFANELIAIDPDGSTFLKEWMSGTTNERLMVDKSQPVLERIRIAISLVVTQEGVYQIMKDRTVEREAQFRAAREAVLSKQAAHDAWLMDLERTYGRSTIAKWKANLVDFDLGDTLLRKSGRRVIRMGGAPSSFETTPAEIGSKAQPKIRKGKEPQKEPNPGSVQAPAFRVDFSKLVSGLSPENQRKFSSKMQSNEKDQGFCIAYAIVFFTALGRETPPSVAHLTRFIDVSSDEAVDKSIKMVQGALPEGGSYRIQY